MSETCQSPEVEDAITQTTPDEKAARRRLHHSNLMIDDQEAIYPTLSLPMWPLPGQAARTELRNLPTLSLRWLLSPDNDCAGRAPHVPAKYP